MIVETSVSKPSKYEPTIFESVGQVQRFADRLRKSGELREKERGLRIALLVARAKKHGKEGELLAQLNSHRPMPGGAGVTVRL